MIRPSGNNTLIRPSEKSLDVAEELLDYVHPGMPRAAALHEVAQMLDEMNADLVQAASALIADARESNPHSQAVLLEHLNQVLTRYRPWRAERESQHELFVSDTSTATEPSVVAGQMP